VITVPETIASNGIKGREIFRNAETNPMTTSCPATAIHRNWLSHMAVDVLGSEKE